MSDGWNWDRMRLWLEAAAARYTMDMIAAHRDSQRAPCAACAHTKAEHCGCGAHCLAHAADGTLTCNCPGFRALSN